MRLSGIRELFWPLLEPIEIKYPKQIGIDNITLSETDNLDSAYDWAIKYYESEEKRRSNVEGKSTIFIGTVGFLITILLNITKDLATATGMQVLFNVIAFGVVIIYLCRVVWFAIKTLERSSYHTISSDDFITVDTNYQKQMIVTLINCTNKNREAVNLKVDYMTMAQEYFKRAICSIGLYAITLIIFAIYKHCGFILESLTGAINNIAFCYIFLGFTIMIIIILSIAIYNLHKKVNKNGKAL